MIKLLTFECARYKRATIAETSYDKKACYNKMRTGQSNLYARKHNVDKNFLISRATCVKRMRCHAKPGLGVSEGTYQKEPGDFDIDWEI